MRVRLAKGKKQETLTGEEAIKAGLALMQAGEKALRRARRVHEEN